MKHPRRRAPATPTIWLIAEDNTGYYVFRTIIKRKNINATVRLRGLAAGISQLAGELEDVIKATLAEKSPRDCIIVLHDLDDAVQTYREDYKRIEAICRKYADDVTLLVANQEIEAWLLADQALCKWLDTTAKPFDGKPQPSGEMKRLVNEKARKLRWNDAYQPEIIEHMDASGEKLSESMRIAMELILQLPCTQLRTTA